MGAAICFKEKRCKGAMESVRQGFFFVSTQSFLKNASNEEL